MGVLGVVVLLPLVVQVPASLVVPVLWVFVVSEAFVEEKVGACALLQGAGVLLDELAGVWAVLGVSRVVETFLLGVVQAVLFVRGTAGPHLTAAFEVLVIAELAVFV